MNVHTNRRMTRAALRERRDRTRQWRTRWAQIGARLDRRPVVRYVRDSDLTTEQLDAINDALREFLADRVSSEVGYTGDMEVAYHNGFPLAAAWLIFSGTEAYELGAVFERLGIAIDPRGWDDGWSEFSDMYQVICAECETRSYARPAEYSESPADADWPQECHACRAALPPQHYTDTYGGDTTWWAECSCGWETPNPAKAERYAKGAATRHLNKMVTAGYSVAA